MITPTNRELTLEELLVRGWQVQTGSAYWRHRAEAATIGRLAVPKATGMRSWRAA